MPQKRVSKVKNIYKNVDIYNDILVVATLNPSIELKNTRLSEKC